MDEPIFDPAAASDLTRAILARTSGSACGRLKAQACEYVDGELDAARAGLVRAHLEHCETCSALVAALVELKTVLPALAEIHPGPAFAHGVLRATSRRPAQESSWRRLLRRPRIALEAAYLGAAAGFLAVSLPKSALPLRPPALVRQLSAPAERVTGRLVQAERRTGASLRQAFTPQKLSPWQRASAWLRSHLQRLRGKTEEENAANL